MLPTHVHYYVSVCIYLFMIYVKTEFVNTPVILCNKEAHRFYLRIAYKHK